jgi:hypothetical protein
MNSNELLSAEILSHVEIIGEIYRIVKKAGLLASRRVTKEGINKTCIIMPNEKGIVRDAKVCLETTKFPLSYDPNHMTIVGGAALNIYDYKLSDLKKRRSLGELKEYIKKKTADIDINWWPVVTRTDMIPIISSEIIVRLANYFHQELQAEFDEHSSMLFQHIKPFIPNIKPEDKLQISVSQRLTFLAGVYNYTIIFIVKDKILKICDINLHDAGSGQRYDKLGKEIGELRPMTDDPTYCNPNQSHVYSISYLTIGDSFVAVPNIVSLVQQQLFAFENLLRQNKTEKALVNYRRVEFIQKVLSSLKLHDPSNKRNYEEVVEVFGTDNPEYIDNIIHVIRTAMDVSVGNHLSSLAELCMANQRKVDPSLSDLCSHVNDMIDSYRKKQADLYNQMIQSIEKKKKITRSILFLMAYDSLLVSIKNKRDQIVTQMTMNEIIRYKERNGVNDYVEFVTAIENIDKRREFNLAARAAMKSTSYRNIE